MSLCAIPALFTLMIITMAHGAQATPRVVIIGAGIGGTSCAYYLSKEAPSVEITILEAQDDVGGRIKDVSFWNTTVALGAQFFNADQRYIAELAKDLNLTVMTFQQMNYPKVIVWDGTQLQTTTDVLARNPGAETEMQSRLVDYLAAVKSTYEEYAKTDTVFESVPAYLRAGGLDEYVTRSASAYFSGGSTPFSQEAQDYLIETVTRMYFGQELECQSLLGMVCLEGVLRNAFYIEGGMSKLVRGLVESSGADLNLNTRVTHIRKTGTSKYTVKYVTDGVDHEKTAEAVVIAAPLEWTDIQFEGFNPDPSTTQPSRGWQKLFTYVCYVVAESLRPIYFHAQPPFTNGSNMVPLFSTANSSGPWVSVRLKDNTGRFNLYGVFSSINLTQSDLLDDLFDGVQKVTTKRWDYLFPLSPPITDESTYQSLILDDYVFNLNGMESIAAQMETSVISARNVARLIAMGKTNSCAVTLTSSLRIVTSIILFNVITLDEFSFAFK